MHNITVSEQSGVECACVCVLRVVQNFVVAYLELHYSAQIKKISPLRRLGQLARSLTIVVRWRRVVYVAYASGDGSIDHEGGAAEPEWVYEPEATGATANFTTYVLVLYAVYSTHTQVLWHL